MPASPVLGASAVLFVVVFVASVIFAVVIVGVSVVVVVVSDVVVETGSVVVVVSVGRSPGSISTISYSPMSYRDTSVGNEILV